MKVQNPNPEAQVQQVPPARTMRWPTWGMHRHLQPKAGLKSTLVHAHLLWAVASLLRLEVVDGK